MHPAKGHQTENVRAQIKKWSKVARGVTAKGSRVYTNCSTTFFSCIMTTFARQSRCIIKNNNRLVDHNVSRRVTVNEQYAYLSAVCTNMETMSTFKLYRTNLQHNPHIIILHKPNNNNNNNNNKLCQQFDKAIGHIVSACPTMPKEQYLKRLAMCALNYA